MARTAQKTVLIVGHYASFAGAGEIAAEFRRRRSWDVRLVVTRKDESQGFWRQFKAIYWPGLSQRQRAELTAFAHEAHLTLVAGSPSLDSWTRVLDGCTDVRTGASYVEAKRRSAAFGYLPTRRPVGLLVTDSHLLMNPREMNALYRRFQGIKLFVMPDLMPYVVADEVYPYWPVVDVRSFASRRRERQTQLVGHSPSKPSRYDQKGTEFITEVMRRNGVNFDLITNLRYRRALRRKRRLDVFVDQIAHRKFEHVDWEGGIGKSGLEALAFGCAVITSGRLAPTEPHFPHPPVVFVNRETFEPKLLALLRESDRIRQISEASRAWAEAYVTPEALVDHLVNNSCGERSGPAT